MDFDAFLSKGWADHADDTHAVAQRLDQGLALVTREDQIPALCNLAHHVHGEHLGDVAGGQAFLRRLHALPVFDAAGNSGAALRRAAASLALTQGDEKVLIGMSASDRIRVVAMAIGNLAARNATRALQLLHLAIDEAGRSNLPAGDPMHRALAANANNVACTMEEKPTRSADERALMILAAQTARRCWALAGGWLEIERAEYRLAMTWLQAGDLAQARVHAQACLDIVAANHGPALEQLFAWEALGVVARAAGDTAAHTEALAKARSAFDALPETDKVWCADSVTKLAA